MDKQLNPLALSRENLVTLLKKAGFSSVEQVFRVENTTMLVAKK